MTVTRISLDVLATLETRLSLATKDAPLPWYADTERSEGEYGSGPGTSIGYDAYLICADGNGPYAGQQKVLFDSHNSTVSEIEEEYDEDGGRAFDRAAHRNSQLIVDTINALPDLIAIARAALTNAPARKVDRDAREQGQREGWAAAQQWLRDRSAQRPPAVLFHAATILADQMDEVHRPNSALTTGGEGV